MVMYNSKKFAKWILESMPIEKKKVLANACWRNCYLTSAFTLEHGTITTYKEGWYIELRGTRSGFNVWAGDNDGTLVFGRKPIKSKLHEIWHDSLHMWESDYDDLLKEA